MKIVVLGNGFDVASGLKTKYKDFFEYHNEEVEKCKTLVEELNERKFPLQNDLKKEIDEYFTYRNSIKKNDYINEINRIIYEEKEMTIKTIKEKFYLEKINFWFFYFHENKKDRNWYDVEQDIKNLVSDRNNISKIENAEKVMENKVKIFKPTYSGKNILKERALLQEDILYDLNFHEKKSIYYKLLLSKYSELNIFEALMKELEAFENMFKKYIQEVYIEGFTERLY